MGSKFNPTPAIQETSKSHTLQTEVKALIIRRIHTHTNRIQVIIVKCARLILIVILAIGVFDSATRPMTFKTNGRTAQGAHANSSLMMERKPQDPQTYDGTTDFKDYNLHFEQVVIWNKWNDFEKSAATCYVPT